MDSLKSRAFLCKAPEDVYRSVYDHGFAILASGIEEQLLDAFRSHLESLQDYGPSERSPYDKTHYSLNGHPDLDHRFYDNMLVDPILIDCLDHLSPGWVRGRDGGDRVKA